MSYLVSTQRDFLSNKMHIRIYRSDLPKVEFFFDWDSSEAKVLWEMSTDFIPWSEYITHVADAAIDRYASEGQVAQAEEILAWVENDENEKSIDRFWARMAKPAIEERINECQRALEYINRLTA